MDINRVVVVADSTELKALLAAHDLQVEQTDSSTAARELLRSQRPDVVFVDTGTPGLDSTALRTISEQTGHRVVICTASISQIDRAIEPLATLTMPYSEEKISALLARLQQMSEPVDPETDLGIPAPELPPLQPLSSDSHDDHGAPPAAHESDPTYRELELGPLTLNDPRESEPTATHQFRSPDHDPTQNGAIGHQSPFPPLSLDNNARASSDSAVAPAHSTMAPSEVEALARNAAEDTVEKAALLILHAARTTSSEIAENTARDVLELGKSQTADDAVLRKALNNTLNSVDFERRLRETVERSVLPIVEERAQSVIDRAIHELSAEQINRKALARRAGISLALAIIALLLALGGAGVALGLL